ncbi:membrane integrity-associated transporter subunit PqiC [Burkholderia sp. 22PA0106]|uniref:PqiC family protein n=1 Tax=Burkholderia sp. 22PA0106 TaxID=3237371 RepID=UPI0039C245E1
MSASTPRPTRRAARAGLKALAALAAATGVALATGCASPSSHFYTLSGDAGKLSAGRAMPANPAFLIQVPAVNVPEQVAKPQLVVQRGDAHVDVLEEHRWASTPADEIRRALSAALTRRLDTIDVADSAVPPGVPVYRVSVDVQRFESWPDSKAAIDAVWSVRSLSTQSVMTCRTALVEPVGAGYDALVAGHRKAIGELAGRIAVGVRAMAAAPAPAASKSGGVNPVAVRCPVEAAG